MDKREDKMKNVAFTLLIAILLMSGCISHSQRNTIVILETGMGKIKIELYDKYAPITTSNFKKTR